MPRLLKELFRTSVNSIGSLVSSSSDSKDEFGYTLFSNDDSSLDSVVLETNKFISKLAQTNGSLYSLINPNDLETVYADDDSISRSSSFYYRNSGLYKHLLDDIEIASDLSGFTPPGLESANSDISLSSTTYRGIYIDRINEYWKEVTDNISINSESSLHRYDPPPPPLTTLSPPLSPPPPPSCSRSSSCPSSSSHFPPPLSLDQSSQEVHIQSSTSTDYKKYFPNMYELITDSRYRC
ncbi:uncharacterized protein RJT21DRAFT_114693 [Scheffersomyces amazonensis]|uniref:uncharacterized protein n=1 Tax=Scheffersomyces amazonensis TaxID=1078765 RepID=UPI00315D4606